MGQREEEKNTTATKKSVDKEMLNCEGSAISVGICFLIDVYHLCIVAVVVIRRRLYFDSCYFDSLSQHAHMSLSPYS